MINRIIIRIKVLQVLYAYYQKENSDIKSAENELIFSMQKAYDLYHYLFVLIILLTDAHQKKLDLLKHKILATQEDLNPNTRLINNRFAKQLQSNKQLASFINEKGYFWNEDESNIIRNTLNKILQSDIYEEYLSSKDTYESDNEFWKRVMKHIILPDEDVIEYLEDQCIYWQDDLEIIGTFILKTIKKFEENSDNDHQLMPMFRNEEDKDFAFQLLRKSIEEGKENSERIVKQVKNWDIDRFANMDLYILQAAIAELKNFDSIPVNVTYNEYIDLARYYSTPKSPNFINGILDSVVNELKKEGLLFKN